MKGNYFHLCSYFEFFIPLLTLSAPQDVLYVIKKKKRSRLKVWVEIVHMRRLVSNSDVSAKKEKKKQLKFLNIQNVIPLK